MKTKITLTICLLILTGLLTAITISCTKDETITKKDPVITWANPADISFGMLLTTAQLNATADVSGTFIYTPAAGTKLKEGANQNLKVDFTPSDVAKYNSISKTTTINVTAPLPITVTDTCGNVYQTITIGTQTWMVENLKTTKYNDGTDIPLVSVGTDWAALNTPAYCWYKNDNANYGATCGALYNWYTINSGKLCPKGWHVPSDDEWTSLETYLIFNAYNFDGTTVGNKYAKALASTALWDPSTIEGAVGNTDFPAKRNATNFNGVAAGCRDIYGTFSYFSFYAFWWSSSLNDDSSVWDRGLYSHSNFVARSSYGFRNGFSVRCLKD
jgi:uncharacterized protein (TIGR02145 family)